MNENSWNEDNSDHYFVAMVNESIERGDLSAARGYARDYDAVVGGDSVLRRLARSLHLPHAAA